MAKRVRVDLEGRTFIVKFSDAGDLRQIMERKEKPTAGGYDNVMVWYHTQSLGKGDTLPKRIIAAVKHN